MSTGAHSDPPVLEHTAGEAAFEEVLRPASFGAHVKETLRKSWLLRIGLVIVLIALFLAAFGPLIAPLPLDDAVNDPNLAPNSREWFGTDNNGFDVFSRVLASARIDVSIALAATILSLVIGTFVGLLTSYFRGWLGELVMRTTDTVQAFPLFVLAIIVVVMSGRSLRNIIIVVALLNIPIYLRLCRSQVLSIRERVFVEAAKANGGGGVFVAFRHVLPNALSPGLAQIPITIGFAILVTAGLSFIGAGVRPPTPEWGAMIAAGADRIVIGGWWASVFPGIAISLTVFGFAVVGEALRAIFLRQEWK